jgi:diguanylate cyclase (GGDEF)-like protein/hemerythrin-like metal-binding protein
VNENLEHRFGSVSVEPIDAAELQRPGACSTEVLLKGGFDRSVVHTNALALPIHGHHLLIVNDETAPVLDSEVERLREYVGQLEREAATDHLTGAWNRAQFDRLIAAEFARSEDLLLPLSLILVDIDHFKRINDSFGHAAGDQVLRAAVRVAESAIRRSDRLFRWGGEEFAVLLADCGYRGAERVAEKLRLAFAEYEFPHAGRVTVSAGVAERGPGESLVSWFGRLDRALYSAKAAGRNRIIVERSGLSDLVSASKNRVALHLQWQEAYECGNPAIDEQHRELFAQANQVLMTAWSDRSAFIAHLERLMAHVEQHFADEESILERIGYPHLRSHKRAHTKLLAKAGKLHNAARHGRTRLGDLIEYLAKHVVADHMLTMDRDFMPFLRSEH